MSRYIDRVLIVMLYELINNINVWRLWFKLRLFLISSLIFLITRSEGIDDISKVIKLDWICLKNIEILVCVVFQIVLISIDLNLLLTRHPIMLQVEVL